MRRWWRKPEPTVLADDGLDDLIDRVAADLADKADAVQVTVTEVAALARQLRGLRTDYRLLGLDRRLQERGNP